MVDPLALDPFSLVVRLALLPFMEDGVKIGIVDNAVVYFQPNYWDIFWRTIRSLRNPGCTKHSLHKLHTPIERAIDWYHDDVPEVFALARRGLDRLAKTYGNDPNSGNVLATINAVIRMLDDPSTVAEIDTTSRPALERLRKMWDREELESISKDFDLLKSGKLYIIESINSKIKGKEPDILLILRESPVS